MSDSPASDPAIPEDWHSFVSAPSTVFAGQVDSLQYAALVSSATAEPVIEEVIGKGGFGIVRRARDGFGRDIAIKYAIQPKQGSLKLDRFLAESEIAAALQDHRGVIPIYGRGERDGIHWYAMQFASKGSLERVVLEAAAANSLFDNLRKHLGYLVSVCETIDFAHSRGVVHGDLSPGNIVLAGISSTFVIDWGLAHWGADLIPSHHRQSDRAHACVKPKSVGLRSQDQIRGGTEGFSSPELLSGGQVTHAADIYSLGALLVFLVTGERVDSSNSSKSLRKLPRRLQAIAGHAMALPPDSRYSSAERLGQDIQAFLDGGDISVAPFTTREKAVRYLRQHRWVSGSLSVLLVICVILIQQMWASYNRIQEAIGDRRRSNNQLFSSLETLATLVTPEGVARDQLLEKLRSELLEQIHIQYSLWEDQGSGTIDEQARVGKGLIALSRIEVDSGNLEHGMASTVTAEGLLRRIFEQTPTLENLKGLLDCMALKTSILISRGWLDEAEVIWVDWKSLVDRSAGGKSSMEVADQQADLAASRASLEYNRAGLQETTQARHAYIIRALEQAKRQVQLREQIVAEDPTVPRHLELARALNSLGLMTHKGSNPGAAIKIFENCLNVLRSAEAGKPERLDAERIASIRFTALFNKIMAHNGMTDYDAATRAAREGIALAEGLATKHPLMIHYRQEVARGWGNLSDTLDTIYTRNPTHENASELLKARGSAIRAYLEIARDQPNRGYQTGAVTYLTRRARDLRKLNRTDEARDDFRQALALHDYPEGLEPTNTGQLIVVALGYDLLSSDPATSPEHRSIYRERIGSIANRISKLLPQRPQDRKIIPFSVFEEYRDIPGVVELLKVCSNAE